MNGYTMHELVKAGTRPATRRGGRRCETDSKSKAGRSDEEVERERRKDEDVRFVGRVPDQRQWYDLTMGRIIIIVIIIIRVTSW